MEAADLLENFRIYWDGCDDVGDPLEARKQLLAKIVDRVFVYDQAVLAVAVHGDFSIVLDNDTSAPHEVVEGLNVEINGGKEKGANGVYSTCTLDGSDGGHTLTCIILVFLPKHIVQRILSEKPLFPAILSSSQIDNQHHILV